jgi:peptidyl-tRNA hydrolase
MYVIMRTDLDSMNPGKAMAQANHAYGAAKKAVRTAPDMQKDYLAWMDTTDQEFGTTIVLGANEGEIDSLIAVCHERYEVGII